MHYSRHGVARVAFASKEVILSAGAFVSPMILMRSGIGPSDQLDLINVTYCHNTPIRVNLMVRSTENYGFIFYAQEEQLLDLPVGYHLQTHPMVNLYYSFNNKTVFKYLHDRVSFEDFEEYKTNGTG